MTTLVTHIESQKNYILIGTGYGLYKSSRPGIFFGNLMPEEDEGQIAVAAVSDKEGNILWFPTNELRVIEIDGQKIETFF
ncbi:hypothetical protein [Clostridiisalibacter paucivorans]|uniref:hypothetical protein n=1 Tax=Clostridiisalibacter paucivorans TaxID=408753 RepID=UPI00047DF655|nr:hypothetical protein [Clostridiisalibacter paucivorans]